MNGTQQSVPAIGKEDLKWLELVIQQVSSLRYGVVEIVVHDSRVIQIEKKLNGYGWTKRPRKTVLNEPDNRQQKIRSG